MAAAKRAPKRKAAPKKPARRRKSPAKPKLTTVAAVQSDLDAIGKLDADLAKSGLAAAALQLAREMDNSKNSATSKSMCARALRDTLADLRALAPTKKENDQLAELRAKRAKRSGKGAAAAAD